jgi:hypothetical protein
VDGIGRRYTPYLLDCVSRAEYHFPIKYLRLTAD